jgi:methylenetetrahydrofolate reductase (NADPH)
MSSLFQEKLRSDKFLVTAEINPPKGTNTAAALADAMTLKGWTDALNITDNQRSVMRMSPMALGKLLVDNGHEAIVQITCRDRNRLALQSDLLGAAAIGIKNICIMTGDHPTCGDQPAAKPVYDLDSVQLLSLVQKMRRGFDLVGNELDGAPEFVVGAVSNTDPTQVMQIMKLNKKCMMSVDFIQTQAVYDVGQFEDFMASIAHLDVPIIAGIIPLKSVRMARFMNEKVPGIKVGDDMISRMEFADDPVHEGLMIAAETIKEVKDMCRGVHLMPIGKHLNTRKLLEMAGLPARE